MAGRRRQYDVLYFSHPLLTLAAFRLLLLLLHIIEGFTFLSTPHSLNINSYIHTTHICMYGMFTQTLANINLQIIKKNLTFICKLVVLLGKWGETKHLHRDSESNYV